MTESAIGRRAGGRAGRQAARLHAAVARVPFLTRSLAPFEVLSDEGLTLIEQNADTILEQVGVEFHDARTNAIWKRTLAEYEPPPIDDAVDAELREWIERKKTSFPDSNV